MVSKTVWEWRNLKSLWNSLIFLDEEHNRLFAGIIRLCRATLGLIFFTVLIQNSEKQLKVLSGCLKNLPSGTASGHQTFPRGCAPRESLKTLGNSLGQFFPDNHCGLSTVYTRLVFQVLFVRRWQPPLLRPAGPGLYSVVLCDAVVLCSAVWCSAVGFSAVQWGLVQCSGV